MFYGLVYLTSSSNYTGMAVVFLLSVALPLVLVAFFAGTYTLYGKFLIYIILGLLPLIGLVGLICLGFTIRAIRRHIGGPPLPTWWVLPQQQPTVGPGCCRGILCNRRPPEREGNQRPLLLLLRDTQHATQGGSRLKARASSLAAALFAAFTLFSESVLGGSGRAGTSPCRSVTSALCGALPASLARGCCT